MMILRILLLILTVLGVSISVVAEQQANDDAAAAQGDDAAAQNNDDAAQAYYYDNVQDDGDYSAGDDASTIKYWTDYAILPKRCIV